MKLTKTQHHSNYCPVVDQIFDKVKLNKSRTYNNYKLETSQAEKPTIMGKLVL